MRATVTTEGAVLPFTPPTSHAQLMCPEFGQTIQLEGATLEVSRSVEIRVTDPDVNLRHAHATCGDRRVEWKSRHHARWGERTQTAVLPSVTGAACTLSVVGKTTDGRRPRIKATLPVQDVWELELGPDPDPWDADLEQRALYLHDPDGNPIAGARVIPMATPYLLVTRGGIPHTIERSFVTDAVGRTTVSVRDDTRHLAVLAEGYGYSLHPLSERVTLQPQPPEDVPLTIDGLPAGETCELVASIPDQIQVSAPLEAGVARFWMPVPTALRAIYCGGRFRARLEPGQTRIQWVAP